MLFRLFAARLLGTPKFMIAKYARESVTVQLSGVTGSEPGVNLTRSRRALHSTARF